MSNKNSRIFQELTVSHFVDFLRYTFATFCNTDNYCFSMDFCTINTRKSVENFCNLSQSVANRGIATLQLRPGGRVHAGAIPRLNALRSAGSGNQVWRDGIRRLCRMVSAFQAAAPRAEAGRPGALKLSPLPDYRPARRGCQRPSLAVIDRQRCDNATIDPPSLAVPWARSAWFLRAAPGLRAGRLDRGDPDPPGRGSRALSVATAPRFAEFAAVKFPCRRSFRCAGSIASRSALSRLFSIGQ